MKANCWMGKGKVQVAEVPDPKILNARDAIVRITSTAICGSDLHLYNGFVPTMEKGDILGHEFMGRSSRWAAGWRSKGRRPRRRTVPDRVWPLLALPTTAVFDLRELQPERLDGGEAVGALPVRHFRLLTPARRLRRGQAEYARVPAADVGPLKIPEGMPDEQVLFLSDIFPTGYMGAEMCNIQPGDVIAVWGPAPWDSSPSQAPTCSAPSASSRSTASRTGCAWRARGPRRRR